MTTSRCVTEGFPKVRELGNAGGLATFRQLAIMSRIDSAVSSRMRRVKARPSCRTALCCMEDVSRRRPAVIKACAAR